MSMVLHIPRQPNPTNKTSTDPKPPPTKPPKHSHQLQHQMNFLCFFLLSLLLCSNSHSHSLLSLSSSPLNSSQIFDAWCEQHGRSFPSEEEKLYRLRVFEDNLDFVTRHNNMGNSSYTLSLNAFADLTHHEFKSSRLGFSSSTDLLSSRSKSGSEKLLDFRDVPASLDWRKSEAVTNVKDQGSCGMQRFYFFR